MSLDWARGRWTRILLGLIVGAAVGLAIYQGSQLSGRNLFVLCGATAGVVAAIIVHGYDRTVRLTDISISVPQFSQMHFVVTKDSQQMAWKLFVEAATRISTQSLAPGTGLVREAMNSLYGLFTVTRSILVEGQPSRQPGPDPTVEQLAVAMLNIEIRPFLSRWHPALRTWETAHPDAAESSWPDDAQCRAELAAMQARLQGYVLGFGKLAGVPNARTILDGTLGQI